MPSTVLPNVGPSGIKVAEAKYGVQPGKGDGLEVGEVDAPPKEEARRKPPGDGKRSPLKKK